MFSKSLLGFLCVVILTTTGCDRFLKSGKSQNDKDNQDVQKIELGELKCLEAFPPALKKYLEDSATPEDVSQAFNCLSNSLQSFAKLTKGSKADGYTGDEVRYFLNRYYLRENQMSQALMDEFLKIKALAVGGTDQRVTRTEIDQLQIFLGVVREQALSLRGSMRILLFKETPGKVSELRLKRLQTDTNAVLQRILNSGRFAGSTYELDDFSRFLGELKLFLQANESFESVVKWLPLVRSLKDLFFGENSNVHSQREWRESIDWAIETYFLGLGSYYNLYHQDFHQLSDWAKLVGTLDATLDLVERSPMFQKEGQFKTASIDAVIAQVWNLKVVESNLKMETVQLAYRMAILRFLERDRRAESLPSTVFAFDRRHLAAVRFEYNVWRLSQEMILSLFENRISSMGVTQKEIDAAIQSYDVEAAISRLRDGNQNRDLLIESWKDWASLLQTGRTLRWTNDMRIKILPEDDKTETSLLGLNVMNAIRGLTRIVHRGYGVGEGLHYWQMPLSTADLGALEKDFHDFAVQVRFIDGRSKDPVGRTFKEANFFTYSGNGDSLMSSRETFEELNFLIVGGQFITNELMAMAMPKRQIQDPKDKEKWIVVEDDLPHTDCTIADQKDSFAGKPLLKYDCFRTVMRENIARSFKGLPLFISNIQGMNEEQWNSYFKALTDIAAVAPAAMISIVPAQPGPPQPSGRFRLEFSEIRTLAVVIHYVEGLVVGFDQNKNGILSYQEIQAAYPRFQSFIRDIANKEIDKNYPGFGSWFKDSEVLSNEIFLFLVYFGKKPTAGDLMWFWFQSRSNMRPISRVDLVNVFSVLKTEIEVQAMIPKKQ